MLTDSAIKIAKPRQKPYKLFDGRGLFLLVSPNGTKAWRFKYIFAAREKLLSLGIYPDVSLKLARDNRDDYRKLVADNIDPSDVRKAEKFARANTFKTIAEEWLNKGCPGGRKTLDKPLKKETITQLRQRLEKYVYPKVGRRPIASIAVADLRRLLERISERGRHETAHRVRSLCERIFRYAIATDRAERNIAADLAGTLEAGETRHFPAITEAKSFGELLRAIGDYQGQPAVMAALKLAPLLFVRPGELRMAEWREFDLDAARWLIPAERMKMGSEHIVPLSTQAVGILTELQAHTGDGKYLFPSLRTRERYMSENTLNACLRRLGYSKNEATIHGFRSSASSLLHEQNYSPELIETQLAHHRPGVAGIYNRSHLLPQRKEMMQAWSDYCDGLKADKKATVTALHG
ncbi:tyrosine-type recombinase/integrase [Candidatus Poribacteria bacterium]|nr:tyrosine-type recombinase/integrase [Candidatus Poribacteria bacterium]